MSLSKEIISGDIKNLKRRLELGATSNEYDPYGYNPLIMSIMTNTPEAFDILIEYGADPNQPDIYGVSPLNWAIRTENTELVKKLCDLKVLIQSTTLDQEPLLVAPILRKNSDLINILRDYNCSLTPAQDFILNKSLGHFFELRSLGMYVNYKNILTFFEYQGFRLDFSINLLSEYWQLYRKESDKVSEIFSHAVAMRRLKTFFRQKQEEQIKPLLSDFNFYPIGFEGHAISICQSKNYFALIDRSHGEHQPVELYQIRKPVTTQIAQEIIFGKKDRKFIKNLVNTLQGELISTFWVARQVTGNCTWANVEVAPMIFELLQSLESGKRYNQGHLDKSFEKWNTWSKEFIFKQALLKGASLEKDRLKALVHTLTEIVLHHDLSESQMTSFINLIQQKNLSKFIMIILENFDKSYPEIEIPQRLTMLSEKLNQF